MGQWEEDGAVDSAVPSIEILHRDTLEPTPIGAARDLVGSISSMEDARISASVLSGGPR